MISASHDALRTGRTEMPGRAAIANSSSGNPDDGVSNGAALAHKNATFFVKAPDRWAKGAASSAARPTASLIALGAGDG